MQGTAADALLSGSGGGRPACSHKSDGTETELGREGTQYGRSLSMTCPDLHTSKAKQAMGQVKESTEVEAVPGSQSNRENRPYVRSIPMNGYPLTGSNGRGCDHH
ncbi:hypothetical protein GCM10009767_27250 [Kocuria aegyptia]|uniref:Uncharacterized protein n=1 Tax=Kocuria aegyptia TaxID=330943 RepID=A0ABN2KYN2_9MICC